MTMMAVSPLERVPWQPAGQHPFVVWRAGGGRVPYWLECACRSCGDRWLKLCHHPERRDSWIMHYCLQHAHGLRPVR